MPIVAMVTMQKRVMCISPEVNLREVEIIQFQVANPCITFLGWRKGGCKVMENACYYVSAIELPPNC
jgi:hypothetical protein